MEDPVVGCLTAIPPSPLLPTSRPQPVRPVAPFILRVGLLKHCSEKINAFWPTLAHPPRCLRHSFTSPRPSNSNRPTFAPSILQSSSCCSIIQHRQQALKKLDSEPGTQCTKFGFLGLEVEVRHRKCNRAHEIICYLPGLAISHPNSGLSKHFPNDLLQDV